MNPEELPIFSKYSSLILIIDASVVGLFIGFNAKIKDKASVLEKAVIGSKSIIGDGIIIHPSVKIMSNEIIK